MRSLAFVRKLPSVPGIKQYAFCRDADPDQTILFIFEAVGPGGGFDAHHAVQALVPAQHDGVVIFGAVIGRHFFPSSQRYVALSIPVTLGWYALFAVFLTDLLIGAASTAVPSMPTDMVEITTRTKSDFSVMTLLEKRITWISVS